MTKFQPGRVIWGKTDKKFWPAIILSEDQISKPVRSNYIWVFWFGDYRISEIKTKFIMDFAKYFSDRKVTKASMGKRCMKGVYEAIQVYGHPDTLNWDEEKLMEWANNKFDGKIYNNTDFPKLVLDKLRFLEFVKVNTPLKPIKNESVLNKICLNFETYCIGCYNDNVVQEHPLFEGYICEHCRANLIKTLYLIGIDRMHYCCLICGNYGEMLVCSKEQCGRAYCYRCIDNLLSKDSRKQFTKTKIWHCFFCTQENIGRNKIKVREDWRNGLELLYNCNKYPLPKMTTIKRKIRVLSVFDGISSGLTALGKINLSVQSYHASEIDPYAIAVAENQHNNNIIYLGDIRNIDDEELAKICPIDLYIGGSPCNDLSIANPNRKGLFDLSGSGMLFFHYYRLLMKLMMLNKQPFFWLFENVASMTLESKETISNFFGCEPVRINSLWVSPQSRERFFWGNCPSLKCNFEMDGPDLQDYLLPGREAQVNYVQTITTRSNSLKQGIGRDYPLLNENNEPDILNITEIERIFGFDDDYTKFADFSTTVRQGLLGKAWSVQIGCMLLHFLKYYFIVNDE